MVDWASSLTSKGKVCCAFMCFLKTLSLFLPPQKASDYWNLVQVVFGCVLQDLDVNGVLSLTVPCPLFLIWMLVGF